MTPPVNYDEYRRRNQGRYLRGLATVDEKYPGRTARQRPRGPGEERLLLQLDRARGDRLIASGELQQLGPRRWRWNL
jgi:hypothetical protein